jgi:hypothetical protein
MYLPDFIVQQLQEQEMKLDLRITSETLTAGDEDIAFDNIRIRYILT